MIERLQSSSWLFPDEGVAVVYVIFDVRDGRVRYVGSTKQHPAVRMSYHAHGRSSPALKDWLRETWEHARYAIVEVVHDEDAVRSVEARWYYHFLDAGADLFNRVPPMRRAA